MPEDDTAPCAFHVKLMPMGNKSVDDIDVVSHLLIFKIRFQRRSELLVVFVYCK